MRDSPEKAAATGRGEDGEVSAAPASGLLVARRRDPGQFRRPHAGSHPARLAAVARILGLDAPPLDKARVLEIGCAAGGDIIPLAAQHPRGVFVGLEPSATQARRGNERIGRLALSNIRILPVDVAAFDWRSGRFDYIICHDAYRYGSPALRAAIRRIIVSCMATNGVACIGCNVLPGWRRSQGLRDILMNRLRADSDGAARLAGSRDFLAALSRWQGAQTAHHHSLRASAAEALEMPDELLARELLSDDHEPETFAHSRAAAAGAGLAYLGDCDVWTMFGENFAPPADDPASPPTVLADIADDRARRRNLFVHAARPQSSVQTIDPGRFEGLHFLAASRQRDEAAAPSASPFVGADGRTVSAPNPAAQRVFEALTARAPASLSFDDLLAAGASARGALDADDRAAVLEAIRRALVVGAVEVIAEPVPAASTVPTHPVAPAWCRIDAAAGEEFVASLRHERVALDAVARALLPLLDGAHDHAALAEALIAQGCAGADLSSDADAHDRPGATERARRQVARALDHLQRSALLLAAGQPVLYVASPDRGERKIGRLA